MCRALALHQSTQLQHLSMIPEHRPGVSSEQHWVRPLHPNSKQITTKMDKIVVVWKETHLTSVDRKKTLPSSIDYRRGALPQLINLIFTLLPQCLLATISCTCATYSSITYVLLHEYV